jgi:hypothetical protein
VAIEAIVTAHKKVKMQQVILMELTQIEEICDYILGSNLSEIAILVTNLAFFEARWAV